MLPGFGKNQKTRSEVERNEKETRSEYPENASNDFL